MRMQTPSPSYHEIPRPVRQKRPRRRPFLACLPLSGLLLAGLVCTLVGGAALLWLTASPDTPQKSVHIERLQPLSLPTLTPTILPTVITALGLDLPSQVEGRDLFAVLDRFPQVKAVLWGHVHQEIDRERNGVRLLASPSTCIQFAPGSEDFNVSEEAPGYRWLRLHADGRLETGVERVKNFAFTVDYGSNGY